MMRTQQEFDELEREWRERLSGRSLVIEAGVDQSLAVTAFGILGSNFRLCESIQSRTKLLHEYRAALTVGLCLVGSQGYSDGTFWPSVGAAFRSELSQNDQREISDAFRKALTSFGLSRFTTPLKNVGEILMHAGIPITSLESYLRVLLKRDVRAPNLDGLQFNAWVRTMTGNFASSLGLDAPTFRFLTEGGEVAEDFIDRCLELLDTAQNATSNGSANQSLPASVVAEIHRLLESGTLSSPPGRGARRQQREAELYPRLTFNNRDGIQVRLPPLELVTESAITWRVSAEGSTSRIEVAAPWPGDPVEPLHQPIGQPAKQVTVSIEPGDQTWNLELVDVDDPLVVFDLETGFFIPARNDLPKGTVWLIYANSGGLELTECVEADGDLSTLSRMDSPYGWKGWSFAEVDISAVTKIRFIKSNRWRYVSAIVRPAITGLTPIPFASSASGRPVTSSRPNVTLPASVSRDRENAPTVTWAITITDDKSNVISSSSYDSFSSQRVVDPWQPEMDALVGEFTIAVRGPLGRGHTSRVAIAESVSLVSGAEFRFMSTTGTGLGSRQVTLAAAGAQNIPTVGLMLSELECAKSCQLTDGKHTLDVTLTIPFMSVSVDQDSYGQPDILPQQIDIEDLPKTEMTVLIQGDPAAALELTSGGKLLQTVRSGSIASSGARTFNLAQIAETVAAVGSALLTLRFEGRSIPVGRIRPRRLADSITVDAAGVLHVQGSNSVEKISGAAYPTYAPWRAPYLFTIAADTSETLLDSRILTEGKAKVVLRIDDSWVPEQWPQFPPEQNPNVFDVEFGQLFDEPGHLDSGFRNWIARHGECPTRRESMPCALQIYTLIRQMSSPIPRRVLRSELADAIRHNREQVVSAVLKTDTQARSLMPLFVESDVVTVPGEAWESEPLLWTYSVGLGVLADSDQLLTDERPLFLNSLTNYVGASSLRIVEDGVDPLASVGKFAEEARIMHAWPPERVNEAWVIANALPGRLLDRDPRASAAKELFDHRTDRNIKQIASSSQKLLRGAHTVLTLAVGPEAVKPLQARMFADGWANLPAVSLAFAICARLTARGNHAAANYFEATRPLFADIAHVAPQLVEGDLALAELWVSRWRNQ